MKRNTSELWAISWSGPAAVSRTSIWSAFNSRMSAVQARDDRNLNDNLKKNNLACLCRNVCLHQHIIIAMDVYRKRLTVQFSCSVLSDSLRLHGLQHARPPCPLPTPRVYSNSCPLSRWCHRTISSVIPFSSHLQSFPTSGSFQMSQLFVSCGQSIGFSFNTSLSNEHSGLISFRMDWLDLLDIQGTLKSLFQYHSSKASILQCSLSLQSNSIIHTWLLEKP